MQAKYNETGKIDTLTVDWLNIWQHPKKQPRMSHKNVIVSFQILSQLMLLHFYQICVIAQLYVFTVMTATFWLPNMFDLTFKFTHDV